MEYYINFEGVINQEASMKLAQAIKEAEDNIAILHTLYQKIVKTCL